MSWTLLKAAKRRPEEQALCVGAVLSKLGDRSFAWAALFFGLLNLIPAPPGSTLLLAPPLLFITGQMALGARYLTLPDFFTRRRVPTESIRKAVIRMRPLFRFIERLLKPRHFWLFTARNERAIGVALFVVSVALLTPLPLTGAFPAWAIVITSLGLLERDGIATLVGLGVGAASVAVTVVVVGAVVAGVETLI
jgi:hypothetical protein